MIKNLIFMLIGGFLTTAILVIIASCKAASEADRREEDYWDK